MLVIGEKINIISKTIGKAMKERDPKPICDMAKSQVEAGANMLDVNIGPASKNGAELMEWLVKTIQDKIDVPLSLDTTNSEAMEAGLKVHKGQALINSASGQKDRLSNMLPLAKKYDAKLIGLAMTEKGIPRDADERVSIAVEILTAAGEIGMPLENLYLDPLVLPVAVAQEHAMEVFEALKMFKQLDDPPIKTLVGLSNISNGAPAEVKGLLDRTYLAMLMSLGLDGAILDSLDKELMEVLKTSKVFRGEILYCHSYLEE